MRRTPPLAALLLLAPLTLAAQSVAAQDNDAPRARLQLDANRDGAIDRAEAAKHPRLAERFDQLDRNKDGRLSRDERVAHRRGGKRHRGGIAGLDADKDGRISRAEFAVLETRMAERKARHAARAGKADGMHGRYASMDFAAIDANRDGYLVRAELRAHHERMRPQREAARKARMDGKFAAADLNRDGRLGRVEVEQAMPRLADRFNWMDENRDGFLGRDELARGGDHGR